MEEKKLLKFLLIGLILTTVISIFIIQRSTTNFNKTKIAEAARACLKERYEKTNSSYNIAILIGNSNHDLYYETTDIFKVFLDVRTIIRWNKEYIPKRCYIITLKNISTPYSEEYECIDSNRYDPEMKECHPKRLKDIIENTKFAIEELILTPAGS